MRMLDNVITENFYPIKSAERANHRHRPVGLGFMGFQDVLYMKKYSYSKPEAMWFAEKITEQISYYAIKASALLASERGSYSSFQGSTWSKGITPKDTITELGEHVTVPKAPLDYQNESGELLSCDHLLTNDGFNTALNWDDLRLLVKTGMRNSLCLAVAPTATISNISNCTQSIEPTYKNLYVKSNMVENIL